MKKKKRKTVQAAASVRSKDRLTWREEKFVLAYIKNEGNATQSVRDAGYNTEFPSEMGAELLRKLHILEAVEAARERFKRRAEIKVEDLLEKLFAQATTTPDEVIDVLRNPMDREQYVGLGPKKHFIEIDTSGEFGPHAKTISASAQLAAVDRLVALLGFGHKPSEENTKPEQGRIAAAFDELFGK